MNATEQVRRGARLARAGARRARNTWYDLENLAHLAAGALGGSTEGSVPFRASDEELAGIRATLSRILEDSIVSFWYPGSLDQDDGGYRVNHDPEGRWMGPSNKGIVSQSRPLWFFSRLARSNYGSAQHLEAARHGFQFLRDRMWDNDFGGFFWEVDSAGRQPTQTFKHIYGQSMALYALSEYAVASGDPSAGVLATKLFRVLEDRAHDREFGGYHEFFGREWRIPGDLPNPMGRYVDPTMKTTNAHLHLMEAIARYCEVAEGAPRQRLTESMLIMSDTTARKSMRSYWRVFQEDWTPVVVRDRETVSYGHDVETVTLLIEAARVSGLPDALLLDHYRNLWVNTLRYGVDRRDGGIYEEGPPLRAASSRVKLWWVQAEGLLSALHMYRFAREKTYFDAFRQILTWIESGQIDWEHGEWYERVVGGRGVGDKTRAWKGPYHHGRAIIECLDILSGHERV